MYMFNLSKKCFNYMYNFLIDIYDQNYTEWILSMYINRYFIDEKLAEKLAENIKHKKGQL